MTREKYMINKKWFLCVGLLCMSGSLFAQGGAIFRYVRQPLGKDFIREMTEKTFNPQTLTPVVAMEKYVVLSAPLSMAIMNGTANTLAGTKPYNIYYSTKENLDILGDKLSTRIARMASKAQFDTWQVPGYYIDFPKMWKKNINNNGLSLQDWQVILEKAYGVGKKFTGIFVPNLRQVEDILEVPVKSAQDASFALQQAFKDAQHYKSGFLAISVGETGKKPTDVLLLDTKHQAFLSFARSHDLGWQPMLNSKANFLSHGLDFSHGAWISFPNADSIRLFSLVKYPAWEEFPRDSKTGKEILQAIEKNYYIYFEPLTFVSEMNDHVKSYVLRYAADEGKPLFNSVAEVNKWCRLNNYTPTAKEL